MVSLIIGLGNIGEEYFHTRHNLGFDLLAILCEKWQIRPGLGSGDYFIAEKEIETGLIRLVWPTTFMNNSGLAVAQVMEKFELSPNDLLIIYDDFNIPLGRLRIRLGGSDGGHNGMASIISHLGTEDILRLRMGIGPVPEGIDPMTLVLSRFREEELEIRNKMLVKAGESVLYLLAHG
ncbi:MAG: aminoacyl-tRNA hydrolase, partial [candidate division Zixibacteria bacterium]|nr:aminoacyl-tRNA hydrolase [candidate division Zixibacteria bacterium]